jgi:hypothetical protein
VWLEARSQSLLGQTLMVMGEQESARGYFQQALTTFASTGMRLEYARVSQAYAAAQLQASRDPETREQALSALREARQTFSDCHAALDLQSVEQLLATLEPSRIKVATRTGEASAPSTVGARARRQEKR